MNARKLHELAALNTWMDDRIFDDTVRIDQLLVNTCLKLQEVTSPYQVTLLAKAGSVTYSMYDSLSANPLWVERLAQHIEGDEFADAGPHIVIRSDSLIEYRCQVTYRDGIIYVLNASYVTAKDGELQTFFVMIADKINLAFRFKEERRFDQVQKELVAEFFNRGLATSEAWQVIAEFSTRFLPDFFPLQIVPKPLAQVLTYKTGDRYLIMRASQSIDSSSSIDGFQTAIPLKVDETICGIPIERNLEYLVVNPGREYPERYQSYLFPKTLAQSELVFPIKHNEEVIAVLNIEHPNEGAFSNYCVEAVRRATLAIGPFVKAIIQREERQRRKEISLLYVMTEILRRMGSLYRHKIGQMLLKSRLIISDLSSQISEPSTRGDLMTLGNLIDEFNEKSNAFLTDMPNYIRYRNIEICAAVQQAVLELDAKALAKSGITIDIDLPGAEVYVYGSSLLKEHIYNLLNNAVLAIKAQISLGRAVSGRITISVTRVQVTDTLEKVSSPARIFIDISDNGGGVPAEHYPHVEDFGYTTRREQGGTGYGLPAAREYVQSLNGAFCTENSPDKGFRVRFFVQEFTPAFHTISER